MRRLVLATLFAVGVPALTCAQAPEGGAFPRTEWFVGPSGNHTYYGDSSAELAPSNFASLFTERAQGLGVETSLTTNINAFLGITGDFSMFFRRLTEDRIFHVQSKAFFLMAGPELKARNHSRVTPMARALFGVARSSGVFTFDVPGLSYSDSNVRTGLAMAFGGGADIRVSQRCSIRGTFDYMQTVLGDADPSESGRQNHNRISLGLLVR